MTKTYVESLRGYVNSFADSARAEIGVLDASVMDDQEEYVKKGREELLLALDAFEEELEKKIAHKLAAPNLVDLEKKGCDEN